MIKVLCSFYDEQSSPNKTVSLLGSVVCEECSGKGWYVPPIEVQIISGIKSECRRCHGDGLLTNQLQFNSNLLECAIAPSFAKEQGWKLGEVIKITRPEYSPDYNGKPGDNHFYILEKTIYVRITDIMADNLCRCGHKKENHHCKTSNEDDCEYCLGECKILDECEKCNCKQYEPRSLDLTRFAFSQLSSLEKGILEAEVSKV